MRPLRVLHASPTWFSPDSVVGGGERWVSNVMRALAAGAPEIRQAMVALGKQPALSLCGDSIVLRVLANERESQAPMDAVSAQLWTEFEPFDLIHVHQALTDFGAYACVVAASLGKTVVITDLGGGDNPIMLRGGGIDLADGIVSISQYAHRMVAPVVNIPGAVMIGPIDTDLFQPSQDPPKTPGIICVGRILPHKGIDRIIRALPPGLKLRVVGRVYHEKYRALLEELAAGKDVEFVHEVSDDELLKLYQSSTLFVQASSTRDVYGNVVQKTELMGLTTLEAMACGLPVVVSADGGSLPELVTDARLGTVFRDHDELAMLLRRHQSRTWPAADAGAVARVISISTYGMRAYGRRLADFYLAVHAGRAGAA